MVVRQNCTNPKAFPRWFLIGTGSAIGLLLLSLGLWVAYPTLTFRGVPVSILISFLEDAPARSAYFKGNKRALHARLKALGVEEQIKDFYRPQIQDEQELDRYIHQLLYDNTGYVGKVYTVNNQGQLLYDQTKSPGFWRWFKLAQQLQLVTAQDMENGEVYVTTSQGTVVPYATASALYPIADLERWAAAVQQNP